MADAQGPVVTRDMLAGLFLALATVLLLASLVGHGTGLFGTGMMVGMVWLWLWIPLFVALFLLLYLGGGARDGTRTRPAPSQR